LTSKKTRQKLHPTELSPTMQIHINSNGTNHGPFTLDALNQGIAAGHIPVYGSIAWHDGLSDWIPLANVRGVQLPRQAATPPPLPSGSSEPSSAAEYIIPFRNGRALIAYYLGVFSLIPVIGVPIALAAITLGILGLKFARANARSKGRVHAWIGILLGSLSIGYHGLAVVMMMS